MREIKRLIVGENCSYCYEVGVNDVCSIKLKDLLINSNPYSHYFCFDENGEVIVAINCYIPCIVEYCTIDGVIKDEL